MKLEINDDLQQALEKIGIKAVEMENLETVLLRMAQLINGLRAGRYIGSFRKYEE